MGAEIGVDGCDVQLIVANQCGTLVNGQRTRAGHFAVVATQVTPQGELTAPDRTVSF